MLINTREPTAQLDQGRALSDNERMQAHAAEAAGLLKNLSHETRLLILCSLSKEELSVGELNRRVGVSQSVLSQHLAVLRKAGLLATRREAQSIFYQLADTKAARLLALLYDLYCDDEAVAITPENGKI